MDERGFITGVRSRFFKNNYYAWEVPKLGSDQTEPYIAGAEEVGNDRRSRQVAREMGYQKGRDFSTATKSNYIHQHPFMIKSSSVRTFEGQLF